MAMGIVSLSGFNSRALLAFCRLVDCHGERIHLWARSKNDPIFLTKYRDWVFAVREEKLLILESFLDFINKVKATHGYEQILLLPISEYFNRFCLAHRSILEDHDVVLPLVADDVYRLISDKYSFGRLCSQYGLLVPEEFELSNIAYPAVAKPKAYSSSTGAQLKPFLIFGPKDLDDFGKFYVESDFYFQEFINGSSYYLLFHIARDGVVSSLSQQNLIQQSDGRSIICAKTSHIHKEEICAKYLSMLKQEGFHGLLMVELRMNKDHYYMIEANPRLWGPMQLVVDAGGDIVRSFLGDNGFHFSMDPKISYKMPDDVTYFWSGGIVSDQREGKSVTFHAYDEKCFFDEYESLIRSDITMRPDTIDLHIKEIEGAISL